MKVEEAKTKVCPFIAGTRFEWENPGEPINIKCICGNCMAWVDTTPKDVSTAKIIQKIYPSPEPSGYCARVGE